jgi:uncharacterized protein YjbI with pentapeptide repeats
MTVDLEQCKGHKFCERTVHVDGFCKFHIPINHKDALSCDEYDALLLDEIINAKKCDSERCEYAFDWKGFKFPHGHVLFEFGIFEEVRDKLKNSWVSVAESEIQNIRIGVGSIQELILSDSNIFGDTMIPVLDIDRLSMENAIFHGAFHCASKSREIYARSAVFESEFSCASTVGEIANFTSCRFKKACIFSCSSVVGQGFGGKSRDEFKVVGFDHSIFENPSQTLFQDVDLRKASFKSVSLIGARFYNVNFYQEELKRNGLFNEVSLLRKSGQTKPKTKRKKHDAQSVKRYPHLIQEYRQLRMAMENIKDYEKSNDFYIGEMENRQLRKFSFILSIYYLSSAYGTNYKRALWMLVALLTTHFSLTGIVSLDLNFEAIINGKQITETLNGIRDVALHSTSTATLQRIGLLENTSSFQKIIDIIFRVFIPIQAAMFVLALRNKTKR